MRCARPSRPRKTSSCKEVPADDQLRALRNGEVHLIVEPGDPPTYRFDPMRDESRLARLVVDDALKRAAGRPEPWRAKEDLIEIPGSRYVDWLIPGIISLSIMNNGLWSIGFMTVQARLRKLLKRLAASPMRRRDYLMAPVLARLVFLGPEVAVPLLFGAIAFGMPIRGGVISIGAVAILGALMWGALGLLMGSRARTFEAASGLMNLMSVPMWVLSGVFFAASNFPDAVQPFIQAAAADGARRCVARGGPRRRLARSDLERTGHHGGMDDPAVCDRAQDLQVAVTTTSRGLTPVLMP